MPSHLTRQVFRRLLANEPIVHRGCLRRQAYTSFASARRPTRTATSFNALPTARYEQRRSFWNFNIFRKKEDELKEADMDPGIEKMMELAKRERMRARMPPLEEVVKALGSFFNTKYTKRQMIPDNQAQLAVQSLRYYLRTEKAQQEKGDEIPMRLQTRSLAFAALALKRNADPRNSDALTAAHAELARLVYEALLARDAINSAKKGFVAYVRVLSETGFAHKAQEIVVQYELAQRGRTVAVEPHSTLDQNEVEEAAESVGDGEDTWDPFDGEIAGAWTAVLRGFAKENNHGEVQHTLRAMQERDFDRRPQVAWVMIKFCLSRDDLPGITQWWNTYRQAAMSGEVTASRLYGRHLDTILKWCLAHNELQAGHEIVKDVMTPNPPKVIWDAIFVWAAGTKKSVDEIDRMMSVMEKSNEAIPDSAERRVPDIATINGLVEFAISKDDPYMAERFIALGRDRNIEPDARTYVLQMAYRLSVDDVDGALIAYKNLQSMDLSSNEDVPTVNRLLGSLCKTQRHDFDTIMNVAGDLSDRHARFEPETVSTLALLHLNRDEHRDVLDLLNTHAYHYSTTERESIRDAIIALAVAPTTLIARAWSGYHIIYSILDETPRPQRTELMTAFFSRGRADMGVRVFQNMRMHSRADTIPTVDTYVAAFMCLAKLRDEESLDVIHNLMKLDYNITVTTYLYNALMIAYTACGRARKALGFWDDIVASKEGPSYNSLHIALRACEKSAFGDLKAKELWALLKRRKVDLDHSLWCSYIAALAGNGDVDAAINVVEAAEEAGDVEVDAFLLGSFFAGAPGPVKKGEVEVWAKDSYPEEWGKLEGLGWDIDEETGTRAFRIDRKVAP